MRMGSAALPITVSEFIFPLDSLCPIAPVRFVRKIMGHLYELTEGFTPRTFHRAKPGPVRRFTAQATARGLLCFQWRPPAGGGAGIYRIERTRDGHDYE